MSKISVKNRSGGSVIFKIPEKGIRREFSPNETKMLDVEELEALSYQPGGRELIADYLLIAENDELLQSLIGKGVEPEYHMDETKVRELMAKGSLDSFMDCLDFAPQGVIDLVIKLSTAMPLNDSSKREALKEKTGFDVTKALQHMAEDKMTDGDIATPNTGRRVKVETPVEPERRTTSKYNVVKRD